jgi:hypothetical protein
LTAQSKEDPEQHAVDYLSPKGEAPDFDPALIVNAFQIKDKLLFMEVLVVMFFVIVFGFVPSG